MDSQIKILGPDGVKRIYKNIYSSVERFQNNTLKDINDFKSAAQTDISAAIQNAISAATNAQAAADNAITAYNKANTATDNANSAATAANTAASNANEKASLAQSAADNANNFVDSASTVYATKTELGDYSKTADIESTYVTQSNYNTKMATLDKTDSDNLASAKLYSDQGDALTLQNAKKDAASNYVTQSAYNTKMSALDEADTNNLATAKSYADTVSNNALNSAKIYVNDAVGRITSFEMSIVNFLPSKGTKGTIYLISASDGSGDDVYDEYIWVADTSKFEKIGTTRVDLSPYAKSADVANTYLAKTATAAAAAKLATARTIALTGSVTGSGTFDGSGNLSIATTTNHSHSYAGSSSAGGAANSAVKLATARSINGTSFDGTGNITTANWGTARNLYIADSDGTNTGAAVSVNGSSNATLKLPATIKAALSGNAATATKLATARTIALSGSVTGSANFDGSGNVTISTTTNHTHNYAGSSSAGGVATSAAKLATARTINGTSFDGTANITTANWGTSRNISISDSAGSNTGAAVSVNGSGDITLKLPPTIAATFNGYLHDGYVNWGGPNISASFGPIDAGIVPRLGANRFAFMNPSAITIEYSRNNGSSWTSYSISNSEKIDLLNGNDNSGIIIGAHTGTGIDKSAYMVRLTISAGTGSLYTELRKFLIYISTNGSGGSYCTITARTQANYSAGNDTWVTFANRVPINGWSGFNVINTQSFVVGTNRDQYAQLRFTFGVSSHSSSSPYSGLIIYSIMGFGGVGWTVPSVMAKNGRMYTYDAGQNVTFPAQVTASGFKGNASSATKLETARTIALAGSVTGSGTFDGSGNLSITTTTNHSHNYAGSSSAGGAANSAVKLATARTIALTGSVKGSGKFDGSGNLSIATTVNCGTTAPKSLANGQVYYVYEN